MQRVKDALEATTQKLKKEVEESHRKGKIPADYSLGFCNAAIFFNHHINLRDGDPKLYDRTTSIGAMPKPVALVTRNILGKEEIFESLRDKIILEARNKNWPSVVEAVINLDKFLEQIEEIENEQEAETKQSEKDGVAGNAVVAT